jgi:hypothetical protein
VSRLKERAGASSTSVHSARKTLVFPIGIKNGRFLGSAIRRLANDNRSGSACGVPTDEEGGRAWRLQHVRFRQRDEFRRPAGQDGRTVVDPYSSEAGAETLEESIPRLRRLEKATAIALEKAIKEGNLAASAALRREHCQALKTLYSSEEKLIKIQQF